MKVLKRLAIILLPVLIGFAIGYLTGFQAAQPAVRFSPMDRAEINHDGKTIAIDYSRPYVRKRTIFGELVPFGQVWRSGANEATALTTDADLEIGDTAIPAGAYTIYTVPNRDRWTLIINRQTGQWGTSYDPTQDLARVEMRVEPTENHVEQFTIRFEAGGDGGVLIFEWETTRASVPFLVAG